MVSCDYEGEEFLAFTRLTLYSFNDWKPATHTLWKREVNKQALLNNKNARHVETCTSKDQEKCVFEYSSLSAAPSKNNLHASFWKSVTGRKVLNCAIT